MAGTDGWGGAPEAGRVVAPDGIEVWPLQLPGLANLSVAEGLIPPGEYGVHLHRTLEQATYVLSGGIVATMSDPETGDAREVECVAGDVVCTPPMTPLSFRNPGPETARVLFICSPPYPPDDGDTVVLEGRAGVRGELTRG